MKTSFDSHIDAVTSGRNKYANDRSSSEDLMRKLAEEVLGAEGEIPEDVEGVTASKNHKSEVGMEDAGKITGAGAGVDQADAEVIYPALATAGCDLGMVEEGHEPAMFTDKGEEAMVGTGIPTDTKYKKTDGMVEGSLIPEVPLDEEQVKEANYIGAVIANSIMNSLEKTAMNREYSEALGILKEAGLLEGYNIQSPSLEKKASEQSSGLEKIASSQPLTKNDIINAAYEYIEFEKTAADVEAQAREDARSVIEVEKIAREDAQADAAIEIEKIAREDAQANIAEEMEKQAQEEAYYNAQNDEFIVKQAAQNPEIRNAVHILGKYGLI